MFVQRIKFYRNIQYYVILSIVAAVAPALYGGQNNEKNETVATMEYVLEDLEYPKNALEPYIDEETVRLHHDKHQAAYVAKLNDALKSQPSFSYSGPLDALLSDLDMVPEPIRTAVRNNGGGVWNHAFYWRSLSPSKSEPSPVFAKAIDKNFGNFENFKKLMLSSALNQFGSGYAWLCVTRDGALKICSTQNQDNPLMFDADSKMIPIFCIDVWEHSYYLKYRNLRADYLEALWNIVNWGRVSERYDYAVAKKRVMP